MSGILDDKAVFLSGQAMTAEKIEKLFSPLGFFTARLDGAAIQNKAELLAALAVALRFPEYFGHNWDALLDCLRSLPEFISARGYAVILENSALLLKDSPADLADFKDTAGLAAEFLIEKHKLPLKVVML
jgi:hypothetical protein